MNRDEIRQRWDKIRDIYRDVSAAFGVYRVDDAVRDKLLPRVTTYSVTAKWPTAATGTARSSTTPRKAYRTATAKACRTTTAAYPTAAAPHADRPALFDGALARVEYALRQCTSCAQIETFLSRMAAAARKEKRRRVVARTRRRSKPRTQKWYRRRHPKGIKNLRSRPPGAARTARRRTPPQPTAGP